MGRRRAFAFLAVAMCVGIPTMGARAQVAAARRSPTANATAAPPPLVHVDEELGGYLARAGDLIGEGKYDEAIQILQALIQRDESGFYAEGSNRFISMRLKANQLLGRMGAKGLKLYRALYDPQAQRLYAEGMASERPEALLRRVSERYLHTTYGPKSLAALATLYFDRGSFSQASTCWRQLLSITRPDSRKAAVLARIAAAHHLAGERGPADRAAETLKKKYPGASDVLGGRTQRLDDFVARVRKLPSRSADAGQATGGWPGLGGVADGVAAMSDCDIVLAPRWRLGEQAVSSNQNLLTKLQAGGPMYLTNLQFNRYVGNNLRRVVRLRDGHLTLHSTVSGRNQSQTRLPAMVHPVVAGDQVILRLEDGVVAYDLLTGKRVWESVESLGMVRELSHIRSMSYYSGVQGYVGDSGRYTLTVGGGRVYTVCDFLPVGNRVAYALRRNPNLRNADDGAVLAALRLDKQGYLKWRIGRGLGDDDVIRNGKFLSAPTYRAERLYGLVLYLERYYLVCLEASDGGLIWQTPVAQSPALVQRYGYRLGVDPRLTVGSAPGVADGRVYVTTNSGVVAAFEAETGQPVWGYQYASRINNLARTSIRSSRAIAQMGAYRPANPVIVAGRRVLCLPADSDYLIALDAATGELLWHRSRRNQDDLSAIDRDRLLLSGPGLFVLRTADGTELSGGQEDLSIHGRPAVCTRKVFASGRAEVHEMDLATYQTSKLSLSAADGLLGNLVSADGKLIAANMLGLCTYFDYDVARAELTKRMSSSPAEARAGLLRQRAQLSFDSGRFAPALADLKACRTQAEARGDSDTASQLPKLFYRTYVALGNRAKSDDEMHRMFLQAMSFCETQQERAHMAFRLAKYHERVGQYTKAAELAQEIAEKYGEEELAEVEIGPGADESVRFGRRERMVPGDRLAGDYIRGLLEKYGRACYAAFDTRAKAALDAAQAAKDAAAMLAVANRWPNSIWRDDALFRAAEAFYGLAARDQGKADDYLAEARRHLYRVARMDDSPHRFSASVALATIYARGGWVTSARKECQGLRELPGDMKVAFGDVRGRLADVLKLIEGGKLPKRARPMRIVARISPPVAELFGLREGRVHILRDQEYRAIRVGGKIAVVKDTDAYLLDPTSRGAAEALSAWKGLAGIDKDDVHKYAYYPPGMRMIGGLSRDGKVLAVADRKTVRGLDLVSAKVVWQKEMARIDIRSFYCMGTGCGVLVIADRSGTVVCLDIARGEVLWKSALVGGRRYPVAPPRIAADLVVLRHDGGKTVTCFSLARGGRIIGKWQGSQWSECQVTDDGLLVMMIDGELTAREAGRIDKPLWRRKYDVGRQPAILGVSGDMVAVSPKNTSGPVEVISITAGRVVATLDVAAAGGMPGVPFYARFDAKSVYLLCGAGVSGRRNAVYGRLSSSRGIHLQKFSMPDGKRLWNSALEDNAAMYFPSVLPIVIGKDHVIVTARHYQANMVYYTHVVETGTGRRVQKIDLQGKGAGLQEENRRRQGIGQPVMTNGRLCVETSEGVIIYGER